MKVERKVEKYLEGSEKPIDLTVFAGKGRL